MAAAGRQGSADNSRSIRYPQWRVAGWWVLAVAVLLVVMLASLAVGSKSIRLSTVVTALLSNDNSYEHVVIHTLRIPRTLAGTLVGAALGVAGALIQALTRNPLADPGLLGINAGAAFFVVLAVTLFGISGIGGTVWFALAGGVVATAVVYTIGAAGRAGPTPVRLTLTGVALSAALGGTTAAMTLLDPASFDRLRHWATGSLAVQGFGTLTVIAPFIGLGLLLSFSAAGSLNAIAMGDDLAVALGARIRRTRALVVVAVTLLSGAATAAVGPIGFVGLMIPHLARWIVGPDQRWIMAFTVVLSPILLLVSDIAGRLVMRPGELQVGIVTAFVGAPVLILLARRRKVSGL